MFLLLYFLIFLNVVYGQGDDPFSNDFIRRKNLSDLKDTVLGEVAGNIPPEDKDGLYYFIITLFVMSTFASTILTGVFLALSVILWSHFKKMIFFWFLTQLTISVFIMSSLNFLINVPATLFALITKEFVQSASFYYMSNVIDFCHNAILFSNLIIAIHRMFVFFFKKHTDIAFEKPITYFWMGMVWVLSAFVVVSMIMNNCQYEYDERILMKHYVLSCETSSGIKNIAPPTIVQTIEILIQFILPIFILGIYIAIIIKIILMKKAALNKYELTILKQAVFIFCLFQISSSVFLLCQTIKFEIATAFLIKRIINTTEICAGAATPCFFFFTSKEIRKLVSVRVSLTTSQANSNSQQRRQTSRAI
ncbi:G-protein coupled receptors family 1 profile domain-containing protein [Caenorhabditis elegans]|uniref:G-protein coupled receptors family 1 profile domain-containing protein n=1 Tax=Caenorhabditis elegans TaxID=6239 RepID=Q20923_CAEEL|nr:G-protein coupled receptors family 1 profile domain-containing protein [Caenorhabditis elegans]CAB01510.4 G-protein coupled receptors family 1 profile domain-containing protein [Caenorhabditis elegans]|eukprot:NP_506282.4 Uncharacterized protein CELE_F57B1.1 [Caenorhabditis elegans]